jgi:hypothetical protein
MTFQLTQITPFVPCTNLKSQIAFYRGVLGFKSPLNLKTTRSSSATGGNSAD